MITYISMLRGVNVGGKKVEMEKLRQTYELLGFCNVWSYIQSGNVIFESPYANSSEITGRIEKKLKNSLGFYVTVVIRTRNDIQKIIKNNPFAARDASKLHVTFLRDEATDFPIGEIDQLEKTMC